MEKEILIYFKMLKDSHYGWIEKPFKKNRKKEYTFFEENLLWNP